MFQEMMNVNWLAVFVSAIAFMAVGFVWYTVFAEQWTGYTGWTRAKIAKIPQNQMVVSYVLTFLTALLTSFVLANFLKLLQSASLGGALLGAVLVWLGFTASPGISNFAFEHRPWGLLAIVVGNTLVSMLVAAVILTLWK
jgi:hypothetical protein